MVYIIYTIHIYIYLIYGIYDIYIVSIYHCFMCCSCECMIVLISIELFLDGFVGSPDGARSILSGCSLNLSAPRSHLQCVR